MKKKKAGAGPLVPLDDDDGARPRMPIFIEAILGFALFGILMCRTLIEFVFRKKDVVKRTPLSRRHAESRSGIVH